MWVFALISVAWLFFGSEGQTEGLCALKFSQYNGNHTACLSTPTGSQKPVSEGISVGNRKYITDLHNYYRATVHRHNTQPTAANMQKMYWDDELAMIAQKWASNCIWEHDTSARRIVPGKYPVGQNLARGHRGWGAVLRHWQSEVQYLLFGRGKVEQNYPIGHYTQMVWAPSSRIGCGYARCNRTEPYYVCNYAPSGNMVKSRYTPYTAGNKTAECPNTRTSGLCDCKGKVCLNGGTLNLQTCQCNCLQKPWIRQNSDCSLDCSKAVDSFACASNGGRWGLEACGRFVNVPFEYCPLTCNLCTSMSAVTTVPPIIVPTSTLAAFLPRTTAAGQMLPPVTQVMPDQKNGSVLDINHQRMTALINMERTTAAVNPSLSTTEFTGSSSSTTPPPSVTSALVPGLPKCLLSAEIAKCGQPNSRGYYNPKYCPFGLDHYCPAMCGTCTVTSCVDYEGRQYTVGNRWMNEYGEMTCTESGVEVRRGCYVEKSGTVISETEEHSYTDRNINWLCVCNVGYSLSCKGVWSPSGQVRH